MSCFHKKNASAECSSPPAAGAFSPQSQDRNGRLAYFLKFSMKNHAPFASIHQKYAIFVPEYLIIIHVFYCLWNH